MQCFNRSPSVLEKNSRKDPPRFPPSDIPKISPRIFPIFWVWEGQRGHLVEVHQTMHRPQRRSFIWGRLFRDTLLHKRFQKDWTGHFSSILYFSKVVKWMTFCGGIHSTYFVPSTLYAAMQKWRPQIMVDLHFMPRSGSHFSRRRSCFHDYKWSSFTFRIVGKMVFVI